MLDCYSFLDEASGSFILFLSMHHHVNNLSLNDKSENLKIMTPAPSSNAYAHGIQARTSQGLAVEASVVEQLCLPNAGRACGMSRVIEAGRSR